MLKALTRLFGFKTSEQPKHPIAQAVKRQNLTYLTARKLDALTMCAEDVNANGVEGHFIEAGCALGGSSILLASLKGERKILVHDVFGMIPPPSERDGDDVHSRYETIKNGDSNGLAGDEYYGYVDDLIAKVETNIRGFGFDLENDGIHLIQGLVQDTMAPDFPIALAHIDVDWYDPVLHCLNVIVPKLSMGGYVVLDDYNDWSGCKKAVDEFLAATDVEFERAEDGESLVLRRVSSAAA